MPESLDHTQQRNPKLLKEVRPSWRCLIKINVNSYHTAHHNVTHSFRVPLCSLQLALLLYTASCPPLLSLHVCSLLHGKKRGKAVIKSYCYKTSLNTDITLRIRININTCPHTAMELGPIKCHHILDIRMLPWQSITKI